MQHPDPDAPWRATYRLQFHEHFTFRDAEALVPYLSELGISALYASPYLQARPGSTHGYDISSHERLNPEVGTAAEHATLIAALCKHGMGHLLDIVPNHMGIGGNGNRWWMDVLENGPSSPFAPFFDIDWYPAKPELAGKVLLPVLGDTFGRVLERGELQLELDDGRLRLRYWDRELPVAPRASAAVLNAALTQLDDGDPAAPELASIAASLRNLPPRDRTDPASGGERRRESAVARRRLAALRTESPAVREALSAALAEWNGTPGEPRSFDRLEELLDDQAYRLAFWRVAAEEINYRRFFDINELAGVRVEVPEVFRRTHALILEMVERGEVTGLRVDHPDGVFDPPGYLRRLADEAARRAGHPVPIWVEKILTGDEPLPEEWPVAGTVGYEQLNTLNGLFVDGSNRAAMDAAYLRAVPDAPALRELVPTTKELILRTALVSELNVLTDLLNRISERDRHTRDFTRGSLRDALRETIAAFPVYRTYIGGMVSEQDAAYVERAIGTAWRRDPTTSRLIFDWIRDLLLLRGDAANLEDAAERTRFVMKFQQLTGPVMAKGVEDTAFYRYNRLVSLNEVGGEPGRFGVEPEEFHRRMRERQHRWPRALSATSTHDTKRSEDVRARINVLSEIPERWSDAVARWQELNAPHRRESASEPIPSANDEYLLYQTLVGAWPLEAMDGTARAGFVERIQGYMEKATHEAKARTSWINPDPEYDEGVRAFVAAILRRDGDARFPAEMAAFVAEMAPAGARNSLAQTLLKLTAPGVPDIYQGEELWDWSLVDPDNRRPVDFGRRQSALAELRERMAADRGELARELVRTWQDGRVKLYLTHVALELRRRQPELFAAGEYRPLDVEGERAEQTIAFARHRGEQWVVMVAPRLAAEITWTEDGGAEAWRGTRVRLPAAATGRYRNLFSGELLHADSDGPALSLDALFGTFPVALLERDG